ncbi:hypothetical protein CcI49_09880 [Frankia sp. CcI49]|nr:hypothetical protein CcI49_09880 [Frankia sp. CcI49]
MGEGGTAVLQPAQSGGHLGGREAEVEGEDARAYRSVGPGQGVADGDEGSVGTAHLVPVPALRLARDVTG